MDILLALVKEWQGLIQRFPVIGIVKIEISLVELVV